MMLFPVAARTDNHGIELTSVVKLRQSEVRPVPYLIAVVNYGYRTPVVAVSFLLPWLSQRCKDSRHLLLTQLAPAWLRLKQLQTEALPLP